MVEDNEGDILLTCDALQGLSFISSISVIKNGNEVISFFENLKNPDDAPDLVLLDIFLPQISGVVILFEPCRFVFLFIFENRKI